MITEKLSREQAFIDGAHWAYDNPKWRDMAKEKPKQGQRMLALFKGGAMLPCFYSDDEKEDLVIRFNDREVNFGEVKITHWMPLPPNPKQEEGTK